MVSCFIPKCAPDWQFLDADEFARVKSRYVAARQSELLVLCGRKEAFATRAALYDGVRYFLSEPYARHVVSNVDELNSQTDRCRRG